MKQILGEEIDKLIKEKYFQSIKDLKADEENMMDIQDLKVESTTKGLDMSYLRRLAVSDDGSKAWGIHITESPKCRLLMQDFKTKKSLVYGYEHQDITLAVMVAEDLNLAMTGGNDEKTVLHCLRSGKTLKVVQDFGAIGCIFRLGSVVALNNENDDNENYDNHDEIVFFDLITQKQMEILPVKVECDVSCMQIGIKKLPQQNHPQAMLFVGGHDSSKLTQINLPKEMTERSNQITTASNYFTPEKNQTERLKSQVTNLKQENQELRDQLKEMKNQMNKKSPGEYSNRRSP
jgi:hypothetical protein